MSDRASLITGWQRLVRSPRWQLWAGSAVFVALRVAVTLVIAAFSAHALGPPSTVATSLAPGSRSVLFSFLHWDAVAYVDVAARGYRVSADPAHFPLYPLLIRAVHFITPFSYARAALIVSWSATYFLTVAVVYFCTRCLHWPRWGRVIMLVLFAPASFFFFAGYPESLAALFLTVVLIGVRERRFVVAAVAAGLASAAIPLGALGAIPLVVGLLQDRAERTRWLRNLALVVVSEFGLIAYMTYLARDFGSAFAFIDAQKSWNRRTTYPFHGLFWSLTQMIRGRPLGPPAINSNVIVADGINDVASLAATIALVALVRSFRVVSDKTRAWLTSPLLPAFSVAAVVFVFNITSATAGGVSPEALARHLGILVPLFLPAALLRREESYAGLLVVFVVLGTIAQTLFCYGLWFT